MRSVQMQPGRVFFLKLETGEVINDTIEAFAKENGIKYGTISMVGGVAPGSKMVVGPEYPMGEKIVPVIYELDAPREMTAFGTIIPNEEGVPVAHIHGSAGRDGISSTGCFRPGMVAWLTMEVIITEYLGQGPIRRNNSDGLSIFQID